MTPTGFLLCFSMESSPPPQPDPVSSVLQTSGLPESMTVGECLSVTLSLPLWTSRFCVMIHHHHSCLMRGNTNSTRLRAITGGRLRVLSLQTTKVNSASWCDSCGLESQQPHSVKTKQEEQICQISHFKEMTPSQNMYSGNLEIRLSRTKKKIITI